MFFLPGGRGSHALNGSPLYPSGQEHMGIWLTTLHTAVNPHDPKHGFWHFMFMHALSLPQSEFKTHSGLQFGGLPKNPGVQAQDDKPLTSLHSAFKPQGEGTHGCIGSLNTGSAIITLWHIEKGSPEYPCLQVHIGLCFITLQSVLVPHPFGQGDKHLKFSHALSRAHSELVTHSGLQSGGDPWYPIIQVQIAKLFWALHWLLGPQGDGLQGSVFSTVK